MDLPAPRIALGAATVIATLLLAACGGSNDSTSTESTGAGSAATTTSGSTSTSSPYGGTTTTTTTTTPAAGGKTALALSADPSGQLAFDTKTLKAKAGTVTLDMKNPSSSGIPHAIAVEGNGLDKKGATVQPGGSSTVTVKLKPGTYTFYCPVPGHKQGGMEGTLTVS